MSTQDQLPEVLRKQLTTELLFSAKTDLLQDGRFGEQWLAVTEQEIMVWQQDKTQLLKQPTAELKDARAVSGVGGGTLLADTGSGPVVIARYTAAQSPVFGFAAKLLSAMAKNEERPVLSEREMPRSCSNCG